MYAVIKSGGKQYKVEEGDTLLLEIAEDTDIRVAKASIARVLTHAEPETAPVSDDAS